MNAFSPRLIAVDWSGAASAAEQRKRIVAADWQEAQITLTSGRTRGEVAAWLIEQARLTPRLIVGLDFAFSYPAWFVREQGVASIEDFWKVVAEQGESWLADCTAPFWGRPRKTCPSDHRAPDWRGYRRADRMADGLQPKSPFQIGGAGAVGTGSLRGIPSLLAMRRAGFAIWPFHKPVCPVVMEIYPRSFTGPVNKSSREARAAYLRAYCSHVGRKASTIAAESEDAFDALCSVIGMARQLQEIAALTQAKNSPGTLEGAIFPGRPISTPAG